MSSGEAKKSQGRRKVNMAKMEKESNLQVTFSKRRVGLFKKASELCTLSGAEAAIVVFSPGDKAHSFGHPDVNTIADRFLSPDSESINVGNGESSDTAKDDLEYLAQVESLIEAEKAKGEEIERIRKACEKQKWIPSAASINELNYQQLECLKGAVLDFGKKIETKVAEAGAAHVAVIPYDQGATSHFNNGYTRRPF